MSYNIMNKIYIILLLLLLICIIYLTLSENFSDNDELINEEIVNEEICDNILNKTIWILWLQGWENAPWLPKRVGESWEINNPEWKVIYVSLDNLKEYINDIDYIYDENKVMEGAAKSDIIRLSLLKNHGGVWADATMLCMQPLDHWVYDAIRPSCLWMYHGDGGYMETGKGPASWFIISTIDSYMITKWKESCDNYWENNNKAHDYFWMDTLFKKLCETDTKFNILWLKVPFLDCQAIGQSHTLSDYKLDGNTAEIKELFLNKPPYALKLWKFWHELCPDPDNGDCDDFNGYYAIKLSTRKFIYKHEMLHNLHKN